MSRPISAGYLERKLRAITGVMGDNPLPDLTDLEGMIVVENDRAEWAIAGNELLGIRGWDTGAGVAAQFAFAIVENPDNSGVITIAKLRSELATSWTVNLEIGGPLSAAPGGMTNVPFLPRDLRLFKAIAAPSPFATHLRDGGHAVTPMAGVPANNQLLTQVIFGGAGTLQTEDEWILPPSSRLWLQSTIVNVQIAGYVTIRERALEGAFELR